jgi:mRNA interferase MazF
MGTYAIEAVQLNKTVKRGEVWELDLTSVMGCEQGGVRPCAIISNNVGNFYSPMLQVVPLTSSEIKTPLPTHVRVEAKKYRMKYDSIALCEQLRSVSKLRLTTDRYITRLDDEIMDQIEKALMISLGFKF